MCSQTMKLNSSEWNRRIGWTSAAIGGITGLILGLWSFDGPFAVPEFLGEYDDTSRRLARLGHIAFFGLGILNLLTAAQLERNCLSERATRAASWLMNFGNIFLPLTLFAASVYQPCKYLMPLPATAVTIAMCLLAIGVWKPKEGAT